jgi:hypothetical protein
MFTQTLALVLLVSILLHGIIGPVRLFLDIQALMMFMLIVEHGEANKEPGLIMELHNLGLEPVTPPFRTPYLVKPI